MKNAKKLILLALCAVLLVGASVMGTLAYLTSTDKVENTFTVGKVEITMDEADVDEYGVPVDGATRVQENEYKLIPGHTYTKDPTIHVAQGSEACYVFVKIENGIAGIEGTAKIADQLAANGWAQLATGSDIWYKGTAVDARNAAQDVAVFGSFTIATTASGTDIANLASAKIIVTAYAIQADGFNSAVEAWTSASGSFNS